MPLYQAVILAIVQGLTEFLPVSSTAHPVAVPRIFGCEAYGLDAAGIIIPGVVGILGIAFFLKSLGRNSLMPLVRYRVAFGIIVIALAFFRDRG